jgi:HupE/UreJ protein
MLRRWWRILAVVFALCFVFASPMALAHDFPLHTVMNSFVKIGPNQADLVIRIPLDMLRSVPFRMNGRRYDLANSDPAIQIALKGVANDIGIWENGTRLVPNRSAGRLTLPSDRSFEDYDRAEALTGQPMGSEDIYFDQGYLDAHLVYPITSPKSVFTIQTIVAPDLGDFAKLTVRYMPLDGSSRALLISSVSGRVALNPPWYRAAQGFVVLGIGHILSGLDHMLFLLCLVIPIRKFRVLVPVVTAFTLGHSATLIGTAYNLAPSGAWFPPFVETGIALSIVYMAVENIVGARLDRRWMIAALFGLVHGFGFSYALKENLQFAGSHLLVSLLAFNVGIEIGQLLILTVMMAALWMLFRHLRRPRVGAIVLSAFVAHTAWHWMIERGQVLWQTRWPVIDGAAVMILARWIAVLLLAGGAVKLLARYMQGRRTAMVTMPAGMAATTEKG